VQCGFCTPGLVVAVHHLLDSTPEPDEMQVKEALSGNICRCTGYGRIIAAVDRVVEVRKGTRA
jgi:carbon-monoxide dehydrogenase small subunit